jgi:hypothetical protein
VIIWQERDGLTAVSQAHSLGGWSSTSTTRTIRWAGRSILARVAAGCGNAMGSVIAVAGNGQGYIAGYGDGGPRSCEAL